jgi:hypothetical protein
MEVENQEGQGPLWAVAPLTMMNYVIISLTRYYNLLCLINLTFSFGLYDLGHKTSSLTFHPSANSGGNSFRFSG